MTDLIYYKWYFVKIVSSNSFKVYKQSDDYIHLSTLADCKAYVDMFTY
jgi:hypothetical protein